EAYLDAGVRGAISTFTKLADVEPGLARLRADLAVGTWERRHGHLRRRDAVDLGYRLVIADVAPPLHLPRVGTAPVSSGRGTAARAPRPAPPIPNAGRRSGFRRPHPIARGSSASS